MTATASHCKAHARLYLTCRGARRAFFKKEENAYELA
jgi:hypothetical protein